MNGTYLNNMSLLTKESDASHLIIKASLFYVLSLRYHCSADKSDKIKLGAAAFLFHPLSTKQDEKTLKEIDPKD